MIPDAHWRRHGTAPATMIGTDFPGAGTFPGKRVLVGQKTNEINCTRTTVSATRFAKLVCCEDTLGVDSPTPPAHSGRRKNKNLLGLQRNRRAMKGKTNAIAKTSDFVSFVIPNEKRATLQIHGVPAKKADGRTL